MKRLSSLLVALILYAGMASGQDCDSPPNSLNAIFDLASFQLSLGWAGADSALKCEIQIQQDGDSTFKRVRINSNTGFTINAASNLKPLTTYNWRVRCACSLPPDPLIVSPFSPIHSFTTPAAPRLGGESNTAGTSSAELYPNPASDRLQLRIEAAQDDDLRITVSDLTGRVLIQHNEQAYTGSNTLSIPTDILQTGQYLLRVDGRSSSIREPFQVIR